MATPTAAGTNVKLNSAAYARRSSHHREPGWNQDSDGYKNAVDMAIRYNKPTTEAAKAIHLICCRSSPLERRKRNTRLTAERIMHRGNSKRKTSIPLNSQGCPSSSNGLRAPPRLANRPGERATPTLASMSTTPETRARGRHLLEGNLPSGKSRNTKVPNSPTAGTHSQLFMPATIIGKGTEPGLATP